ncbi:hypothetical protein [Pseudodesulfovibrio indicus]|uniref:Uncharacterized protein n=1 Tax=Pseudodesulfovibrio indicus TaxID=1716143 RepID=A0A126QLW3_9BACT|nr:hypothetical protein [Pseudodesulfovibrio indicus]AMK10891.1 hypothetical protein AWY79_07105 [Pseudodesulfovibrio indicus]TDT91884.1 hypothetical protein EDC59_101287 [Pseudodesulfovibrio indicus]
MRQLSLFDTDPSAELAMLMASLKSAMNRAAARCGLSREEIADLMNEIAKSAGVSVSRGNARSVTLATLEKWLNPANTEHQPSVLAVNVFCMAVKSAEPLAVLLRPHGCGVMTPQDKKLRDYANAILEEREAKKRKKQLEMKL